MIEKREIGGYLELEHFIGQPYHKDAIALNSGRGCLSYLIELRGIEAMWVPDFLGDSLPPLLNRENVKVLTYFVTEELLPNYNSFEVSDGEWLLLVDYYGQLLDRDIDIARTVCNGRLIVDETQGFFRLPWSNADTTYTCRKWFGVADGGYLSTSDGARLTREMPVDESHRHMDYLLGRFERPAGEFFAESKDNNDRFADEPAKSMSPVTSNLLRAIDYSFVKSAREKNFAFLHKHLRTINLLKLRQPEGPYMYPLLVEDAGNARALLADQGIYIPTMWANVLNEQPESSIAYRYSKNILPLPIDQRYDEKDMEYMLDLLLKSLNE